MGRFAKAEAQRLAEIPALMAEWYAFKNKVYGTLTHEQEDECRRSFFGGFAGAVGFYMALSHMPEPSAVSTLEKAMVELRKVPRLEFGHLTMMPPQFQSKEKH